MQDNIMILKDYLKYGNLDPSTYEAISTARDALKKEQPRCETIRDDYEVEKHTYHCPVCGARIIFADQKYCDECGQAIYRPQE